MDEAKRFVMASQFDMVFLLQYVQQIIQAGRSIHIKFYRDCDPPEAIVDSYIAKRPKNMEVPDGEEK